MSGTIRLTGATRLYAIVGDPVVQVRSPEVFTARFAADGVDAVLIPVHAPAAHFDAIVLNSIGPLRLAPPGLHTMATIPVVGCAAPQAAPGRARKRAVPAPPAA